MPQHQPRKLVVELALGARVAPQAGSDKVGVGGHGRKGRSRADWAVLTSLVITAIALLTGAISFFV